MICSFSKITLTNKQFFLGPKKTIINVSSNVQIRQFKNFKRTFLSMSKKNNIEKSEGKIEGKTPLAFFQEIKDEIEMVEWPTIDRLLKQFVIVVISLVFSALLIFSVDGLFATISKTLFEGKS